MTNFWKEKLNILTKNGLQQLIRADDAILETSIWNVESTRTYFQQN